LAHECRGSLSYSIFCTNLSTTLPRLQAFTLISLYSSHLSLESFQTICQAVGACTRIKVFRLENLPTNQLKESAACIANAVMTCPSLQELRINGNDTKPLIDSVERILANSESVKDFGLCFAVSTENKPAGATSSCVVKCCTCKWKRLLEQDIQLNLWDRILAVPNTECKRATPPVEAKRLRNNEETRFPDPQDWRDVAKPCPSDHSPRDILFFLLKEKNDLLIPSRTNRG